MERIYDILQRIQSLWKELELTRPDTSEYNALLNQIRVLSDEYVALIDVPKKPTESK
jgi:serine/threonine-protein kinase RIO1